MTQKSCWCLCVLAALFCGSGSFVSAADEWGNLTLTFRYDGDPPKPVSWPVRMDRELRNEPIPDESLIIHPQNHGIANFVAFVIDELPPERISWEGQPPKESTVQLVTEKLLYKPHVLFLRTDQTLELVNRDPLPNNPMLHAARNISFNVIVTGGEVNKQRLPLVEAHPVRIGCSLYPWKRAWVIVRDNPYCGISDESGRLVIKNLPVGELTLQLFHERRTVEGGRFNGRDVVWSKGRMKVNIVPGGNDLGKIEFRSNHLW